MSWQYCSCAAQASLGTTGIGLMALLSIACIGAALGLRSLAGWGHKLALALLGLNLLGDAANAMSGHYLRALLGIAINGLLIAYLLEPHTGVQRERGLGMLGTKGRPQPVAHNNSGSTLVDCGFRDEC